MEMQITKKSNESINQLAAAMQQLNPAMKNFMYGNMTYAAAQQFAKSAKATNKFSDKSGRLRKSIKAVRVDLEDEQSGKLFKDAAARAIIGGRSARHAHLLEWGTEERRQTSTGRATGQVKPRRILTESFETQQEEAARAGVNAAKRTFKKMVKVANNKGKLTKREVRVISGV